MNRRGLTLIEILVALVVSAIVLSGIISVFLSIDKAQKFSMDMPTVQRQAQDVATIVANALRRSTLCTSSDSGCTVNAAIEGNSASGVTIYSRPSSTLVPVTYAVNSGDFQKTVSGSTTTIYSGVALALTYYSSSTYHANSLVSYTPTSSTTPQLIGVKVVATVTDGSASATYTTVVRLRSGPLKTSPTD